MGNLPPSRSWSGDWGQNKVPYSGNHWISRDNKPPRRSNKMRGCLIWFLIACGAVVFLAFMLRK